MTVSAQPKRCSVCVARGKMTPLARGSRVVIEGRSIAMCKEHAGLVAIKMPRTWDDLQAIFRIEPDRRSPIPRRSAEGADRRIFPPRPEGRRFGEGRRKDDD